MPKTIIKPIAFEGIGVHSGEPQRILCRPSKEAGIFFQTPKGEVGANVANVQSAQYGVVLANGEARIAVVEHLLAALLMAGIDALIIETSGNEIPILDGSALPFYRAFKTKAETGVLAAALHVGKKIVVSERERFIAIEPYDACFIDITIDYAHLALGRQRYCNEITEEVFASEIAGARTFGFLKQAQWLKSKGYALGASEQNALIFDETGLIKGQALRFEDEPVRHKVLDILGDFALLGRRFKGKITGFKPGHSLHVKLVEKLMKA